MEYPIINIERNVTKKSTKSKYQLLFLLISLYLYNITSSQKSRFLSIGSSTLKTVELFVCGRGKGISWMV